MKTLKDKILALKESTREETGAYKYDACYDECIELLENKEFCVNCGADLPENHPLYEKHL